VQDDRTTADNIRHFGEPVYEYDLSQGIEDGYRADLPAAAAATLAALADQFARAGTDGLESPRVFQFPRVQQAGGLSALRALGRPAEVIRETKSRLFAA
jgi:hypothetical protein